MLSKRIIPCLDVKEGRVVKGIKFKDHRDVGDPVELAKYYDLEGADELVFYDITASSDNRNIMYELVSQVAEAIYIPFTVGGGIRSVEDIRLMLNAGADKVSINTAAVENPQLIKDAAKLFGTQCIVLGMDAKAISETPDDGLNVRDAISINPSSQWEVRIRTGSGDGNSTNIDAVKWARYAVELGVGEIVLNSMDMDGTRQGYDLDLNKAISERVSVPVVASGGAGGNEHFLEAFGAGKVDAVLAASIFHYGDNKIQETKKYLFDNGISVRYEGK